MKKISALGIPFLIILAGCASQYSEKPLAIKHQYLEQKKIQAAAHWQAIAQNEAGLIAKKLEHSGTKVYVKRGGVGETAFSEAYEDFLTSALLASGQTVSLEKNRSQYEVSYDVQVVNHKDQDSLPLIKPGFFSALTATAYILDSALDRWSNPEVIAVPIAALADWKLHRSKFTSTPTTEVIITTKLKSGPILTSSSSSIYYLNTGDRRLYDSRQKGFNVVESL